MTKNDNNGEATGEVKKKNTRPQAFTPMNARQAQEASVRARNLRKQVRAEMLNTVVQNYNFGEELMKALKKGDTKKVELLQTAMRLIGLHYDQSEDAVNKLQIDATTDNKVDNTVHFVLGERPAKS
jgi:UPF0288 family protein (methanogenesis marker protein 3)